VWREPGGHLGQGKLFAHYGLSRAYAQAFLRARMWPLDTAAIQRHLGCRIRRRELPKAAEIGSVMDHLRS
jgi:hypothetical protein